MSINFLDILITGRQKTEKRTQITTLLAGNEVNDNIARDLTLNSIQTFSHAE